MIRISKVAAMALCMSTLGWTSVVRAEVSQCEAAEGTCELNASEDSSSYSCECASGSAGGGTGSDRWVGLSQEELDAACLEQIQNDCGEGPPLPEPTCSNTEGSCWIDLGDEPVLSCSCAGTSGGGEPGDPTWNDLNERELQGVCIAALDDFCAPFTDTDGSETDSGDSGGGEVGADYDSEGGEAEGGGTSDGEASGQGTGGSGQDTAADGGKADAAPADATASRGCSVDPGSSRTPLSFMLTALLGIAGLGARRR